jgi:double-stranded uracil-DNA glycosylase
MTEQFPNTLPDLLHAGLDLVFVGINPSLYSVVRGHYFARGTNRFWRCFSRSVLSQPIREALGVATLEPVHDRSLPAHGIGFTDVVKRPTTKANELRPEEFEVGAKRLRHKLQRCRPRMVCFHGMTGFRPFAEVLGWSGPFTWGDQPIRLGPSRVFVVPSPSGANAHVTPAEQTAWYDCLAQALAPSHPTAPAEHGASPATGAPMLASQLSRRARAGASGGETTPGRQRCIGGVPAPKPQ